MRGYIKITGCLLALSVLAGCGLSDPTGAGDIKVQIKEMNLDGAKAMAHLQSGNSGTKASMEFGQEEALYLVYDNNEIRLPEIKFTVDAPDSWSEWKKSKWLEALHVNLNDPMIKDFGEYIYVYSSLDYYIEGNGIWVVPPHQILQPDKWQMPIRPHSNTLIRKSDGYCWTLDDKNALPLYYASSRPIFDSHGHFYYISYNNSSWSVFRVNITNGEIEVKSFDILEEYVGFLDLRRANLLEYKGNIYVAGSFLSPTEGWKPITEYGKISSDFTYEKVHLEGQLLVFEKYGDNAYLLVAEEHAFKIYNIEGELVTSAETGTEVTRLLSADDGLYVYYCSGSIVRFDANSGECTVSEVNETISNYLSYNHQYYGGKFYVVYSPEEENFVDVLTIDVMAETVEQLRRFDIPAGCRFNGGSIVIEDECEGKVNVFGSFIRNDDGELVEEFNQQIIVPEIAQAYAEANAVEDYGIDFGTYKVVNVVPLTDDPASLEN